MKKFLIALATTVALVGLVDVAHAQPAPTDNCGVGYYMPCSQFRAAIERNRQAEREQNARHHLQAAGQVPTQAAIQKLLADNEEANRIDGTIERVCNIYARGFIVKGEYLATVTAIRDYCKDPKNVEEAHAWSRKMYPPASEAHTRCMSNVLAHMHSSTEALQYAEAACSGL
jgi:hypothetical protein